eukprot:gene12935-5971_t
MAFASTPLRPGSMPLSALKAELGEPCTSMVVVEGSAPRLPPNQSWVAVPPETISTARLQAGQVMLPSSSAMLNIWHRAQSTSKALTSPGTRQEGDADGGGGSRQEGGDADGGGGKQQLSQRPLGQYFIPARVWPSSKLPRGTAVLSSTVAESLGGQPVNAVVLLYRLPSGRQYNQGAVPRNHDIQMCEKLTLRLYFNAIPVVPVKPSPGSLTTTPVKKTPTTKGKGSSASSVDSSRPSNLAAPSLSEWMMMQMGGAAGGDATSVGSSKLNSMQRELVTQMALKHLVGRSVLPGNPISLPLLGSTFLCQVDHMTARAPASLGGGDPSHLGLDFTSCSALGGVQTLAASLREMVTLPLVMPQLFAAYRIRPPRGVLLWGPPGSGKTVLAKAAAADAGAVLLVVNGPDIVSEFYGESEAALKGIFAAARALSPSVIFIDEIDAVAPSREKGSGGGMSDRLLTALLTLMDGADSGSSAGDGVIIIAATNRPDAPDYAIGY